MSLLVYKDGQPLYEKNYGYRHVKKQLPVTQETVFGVASITKSFACLAIMQLNDLGKLSIHDPVIKWLPEAPYSNQVTIHHLMTHTSGLPGLDVVNMARAESILKDPDGPDLFGKTPKMDRPVRTVEDVLAVLAGRNDRLLGQPGEMFNYSNEGYALLQEIIERASGQSLIDYMQEYILGPLKMERSTFLTTDLNKMDNVTELYASKQDKDDKKQVFHSPAWWDVGAIYTNGSLKSTAQDLIKYLEVYRQDGVVNGKRIISEKGLEKMRTSQYVLPNDVEYGYGWVVENHAHGKLYGHGGSIKGVSSYMLVDEELGATIVLLTNVANIPVSEIALKVRNHLFDLPETKQRDPEEQLKLTDQQLIPYTGTYQSAEGHKVEAFLENNQLQIVRKQELSTLKPDAEDRFISENNQQITFLRNNDQRIKGIFIGLRFLPKVNI